MKNKWFLAVVLLQTLVLLGIAGTSYAVEWLGREIRLQTVPVDPRDVLYGDYVTLSYEMSRMPSTLWKGEGDLPERGDIIYIVLTPQNDVYSPVAVYPERIAVSSEQVLLKGVVAYSWDQEISVRYGLERYYVPEGTGLELERQSGDLTVVVKVAPWGQPVLTDVLAKN